MHPERGFSIVELLVALCLTAVLLIGTFTILKKTRESYEATTSAAESLETAQRALDRLSSDIRSVGFGGCFRSDADVAGVEMAPIRTFPSSSLTFASAGHFVSRDLAANSDVLVLHVPRQNSPPLVLTSTVHGTSGSIEIDTARSKPVSAGDMVMIYNCTRRAFAHVGRIVDGQIHYDHLVLDTGMPVTNSAEAWFQPGDELIVLDEVVYFLAKAQNEPSFTLWRWDGKQEWPLLKDVERLVVSPDTTRLDRSQTDYRPEQADWSKAREAQVALLLTRRQAPNAIRTSVANRLLKATVCIRNRCLPGGPI